MRSRLCPFLVTSVVSGALSAPLQSVAAQPATGASASAGSNTSLHTEAPAVDGDFRRFRPTPVALELGIYAGAALFSDQHNLQDLDVVFEQPPSRGHQTLAPGVDVGLRAGFYPLSWLGAEAELGAILSSTGDNNQDVTIWTYRFLAVAQLPAHRLVPFATLGAGGMDVRSGANALGNDSDPGLQLGVGAKYALAQTLSLRFDLRDNLMQKDRTQVTARDGDWVQHFELLLGASLTLGRTPRFPPRPRDTDGDGFPDRVDRCREVPGVPPLGCPASVPRQSDADDDGYPDQVDACPREAEDGVAPLPSDGCPNKDPDQDGYLGSADRCPTERGVAPDGCPVRDRDEDGILDSSDACPEQPESKNGFEDEDGCPDEVPKEVAKFTGTIQGIQFDFGKASIRPTSHALLDEAVKVLEQYPALRILVSGHTDNVGDVQSNTELSLARAEAVKAYLVAKGIAAGRIETRGAGPSEPVADNGSERGRQENRRIEFKLLSP